MYMYRIILECAAASVDTERKCDGYEPSKWLDCKWKHMGTRECLNPEVKKEYKPNVR